MKTYLCKVHYKNGKYETDSISVLSPTGKRMYVWLHCKIDDEDREEWFSMVHRIAQEDRDKRTYLWELRQDLFKDLKLGTEAFQEACRKRDKIVKERYGDCGGVDVPVHLTKREMELVKKYAERRLQKREA